MNWAKFFRMVEGILRGILARPSGANQGSVSVQVPLGSGYSREAEENEKRTRIVSFVRAQLGEEYIFGKEVQPGQEDQASAWDCSEVIESAYRRATMRIPDGAQAQFNYCRPVKVPKAGDLGFLWSTRRGIIGHVMCVAENKTLIHEVSGRGVVQDPIEVWEKNPRFRGWRRHPDFICPVEERA